MRTKNDANLLLEQHLGELGLKFEKEYAFALPRKWRFDYVLFGTWSNMPPSVAIEIEGGIYINGRHNRAKGFLGDIEKYREAAARGWKVYRFSTEEVLSGVAREFVKQHCF